MQRCSGPLSIVVDLCGDGFCDLSPGRALNTAVLLCAEVVVSSVGRSESSWTVSLCSQEGENLGTGVEGILEGILHAPLVIVPFFKRWLSVLERGSVSLQSVWIGAPRSKCEPSCLFIEIIKGKT